MRVFPSLARSLLVLSGLVLLLCLSFVSARSGGGLSRRPHADRRAVLSHDGAVRRAVSSTKKTTSSTSKKPTSTPSKKAVKTTTSSSRKTTSSSSTKRTTSSTSTKKTTTSSSSTKKSSTSSSSTKKSSTSSSSTKKSSTSSSSTKKTSTTSSSTKKTSTTSSVKPTTTTAKTSSSSSSVRTSTSTSTVKTSSSTSTAKTSTSTSTAKTSTSTSTAKTSSSTSTAKTSSSTSTAKTSSTSTAKTSTSSTSTSKSSSSSSSTRTSTTSSSTPTSSTSTRATTTTARIASLGKPTAVPLSSGSQLLLQSNLAWSTTPTGYLLMQSGWNQTYAVDACWAYSESLANPPAGDTDLTKQLRYLIYRGVYATGQNFRTANDQTLVITKSDGTYANSTGISTAALLPVLCTQSAPRGTASTTDTTFARRVAVSDGATYVGYRDALSFRFLGVPYANPTDRFEYSTPILNSTGQTYDAYSTSRARQCPQTGVSGLYSESCLVLNIYTPYLPRSGYLVSPIEPISPNATDSVTTSTAEYTTSTAEYTTSTAVIDGQTTTATTTSAVDGTTTTAQPTADPVDPIDGRSYLGSRRHHNQHSRRQATARAATSDLRPVMVYFHGGGLTGGTGLDSTFDGGQMVSRGDVLVVTVNYRLGTLGWLPFNDGVHNGNYGFADCITALQWVQKHIATFGGDPNRVTLFGQSAGANQVKRLMISPMAAGLFHRAISQSGSAADDAQALLGLAGAQASAGRVRTSLGCGSATSVSAQLACLRALPASDFVKSGVTVFSRSIVDGTYITKAKSALSGNGGYLNKVPFMLGYMRDERASLGYVPPPTQTNLTAALIAAGVKNTTIAIVLNNTAVFTPKITHGVQNLTVQVQTLDSSTPRCGTTATAFASVVSGALDTVYAYVQDQRAWQLPTYDPNNACQTGSRSSMLVTPTEDHSTISDGSSYYFCHSGDILPTFANAGYQFGLAPRDAFDLPWLRNQIDQWASFARTGNPNPAAAFISARGYSAVVGDAWPAVSSSATGAMMMSLGPSQRAIPLNSNPAQCDLLGRGLSYILDEGSPSQTQITGNATAMNMGEAIPVVTAEVPAATVSQARRAVPTAPGSGDEDEW